MADYRCIPIADDQRRRVGLGPEELARRDAALIRRTQTHVCYNKHAVAAEQPCKHIGGVQNLRECTGCGGAVKIKVFRCRAHGMCTVKTKFDNLPGCDRCEQYEPRKQPIGPPGRTHGKE